MGEFYCDTRQLRALGDDLRWAADDLKVDLPKGLAEAAEEVKKLAKTKALAYPSKTGGEGDAGPTTKAVAESIHIAGGTTETAIIRAGGDEIPLAGLWELGNKGSNPNAPQFWHPTGWDNPDGSGGRTGRAYQNKWPYLRMAAVEYSPRFYTKLEFLVERILKRFHL